MEQSHKDELGVFVDPAQAGSTSGDEAQGEPMDPNDLLAGAEEAIEAMSVWWEALVEHAQAT